MKIKFCSVVNDMSCSYVSDVGVLEVSKFSGYELFCKLYERMEGVGSKCGVSKSEFESSFIEMKMGDWLVLRDNDGVEWMSFVKI